MSESVTISKRDIWTAIWLSENSLPGKAADMLRAFLVPESNVSKSTPGARKVAVVVGHNSKAPGAFAEGPVNASEYQLNGEVADLMAKLADDDEEIDLHVFRRQPLASYSAEILECYRRVNAWNPEMVIELHFNWLAGAGRVEMVVFRDSQAGEKVGQAFLDVCGAVFPGQRRLLSRRGSDRGGKSLVSAKAPCVLTECWDCSNSEHRAIVARLGANRLAMLYFTAIKRALSTLDPS
ncbi:N-acetylmuramoyl-L-alanine amidase [Roseibacillus ishigakijimensis]|uniref:N-acetylmuramoyl-L-alanine amidase n=1 Tax=Roseibacillus ishigakijimensis TaxID=454146 RepID=A0A934RNE2_9BACT|nr:N-acetylmuramoyl-L-alanine amidase [Roseibacillus ishigakijimensis]MBK1834997.1 N-acetylmuramoyl-L-alanine amidase [Roseibacillus ishigakijimensis]